VRRLAVLLFATCVWSAAAADQPPGGAKAQPCAVCHGPLGIGNTPDAPHLAGQPRIYLVEQLKQFRSGKRSHEVMNVIAKPLSDADIGELADWFSSISVEAKAPR
jgi:cytochrome c553